MKDLRVIAKGYWSGSTYVIPQGRISFTYHGKTCEFGASLTDDGASRLVQQLKTQISRVPG